MTNPWTIGTNEMPKSKNCHKRRRWRDVFWLSPVNQLLWHVHRSSSILFCVLVSLNMLAGVRPFTRQNEISWLNNNNRTTSLSNSTGSSSNNGSSVFSTADEDELTREILALFEYDEKLASSSAEDAENNLTTTGDDGDPSNGTTNVNSTAANSPFELLQFSIDPPSDQSVSMNLTGDWMTGGGRNGNSVESGQSEQLQNGLNMDTTNATPTTAAAAITTTSSSENASALGNISSSSTERELETETTESTTTTPPSLSTGPSPTLGTDENRTTEEGIGGRDVSFTRGEAVQALEDGHKNGKAEGEDDNFSAEIESIRTSFFFDTQTTPSPPISRANDAIPSDAFLTMGNDVISAFSSIPNVAKINENAPIENSTEFDAELLNRTIARELAASTTLQSIEAQNENINNNAPSTNAVKSNISSEFDVEEAAEVSATPTAPSTTAATDNAVVAEGANRVEEMNVAAGEGVKEALEELKRSVERKMRIGDVEFVELSEYRQHLRQILTDVESVLSKWPSQVAHFSDIPKSRRFISISASMPDRNSGLFIARKNAILASVSSNFDEIRKSPSKLGTTTATTAKLAQQISTASTPLSTATHPTTAQPTSTTNPTGETTTAMRTEAPHTETGKVRPSESLVPPNARPTSSGSDSDERPSNNPRKSGLFRVEHFSSKYFSLNPLRNNSLDHCKHLAQDDLVRELKQKGTYNPELMAWDVSGVFRFLDKTITDQYERQSKPPKSNDQAVKRNVEALERLLSELNLRCDVRSPEVLSRLGNLTMNESKRSIISPSLRHQQKEDQLLRHKRNSVLAEQLVHQRLRAYDEPPGRTVRTRSKKQKIIGDVHAVPFGCDKRGDSEDGYLRLCGACQAIRKLPDEFFPPFINEVVCDEDKACLYFYDYPHGKCKQKHMNFVVLKNVGTPLCQIWEKFNLNVRVSCECFVDEMSFFSKYV